MRLRIDIDELADRLLDRHGHGRSASIVVVAEGAAPRQGTVPGRDRGVDQWGRERVGGAGDLVGEHLAKLTGFETRTTVLGHIQRGGSPTPVDRRVASRLGARAVEAVADQSGGHLIGIDGDGIALRPIADVAGKPRLLTHEQLALLGPLSTASPVASLSRCGSAPDDQVH